MTTPILRTAGTNTVCTAAGISRSCPARKKKILYVTLIPYVPRYTAENTNEEVIVHTLMEEIMKITDTGKWSLVVW
jgi:hypothetical protein